MALLFAGGIMNLVWIAGLAIFVLVEKFAPYGQWFARITGALFLAAGIYIMAAA
jgi:predicted metal-binding membrane protein